MKKIENQNPLPRQGGKTCQAPSAEEGRKKAEEALQKVYAALDLKRRIAGVRLLHTKEEYDLSPARSVRGKTAYCVMVKTAMNGHCLKAELNGFSCLSAARALGMQPPAENWLSGHVYREKGMYRDLGTAKKVVDNTACIRHKVYGAEVMPLEAFQTEPHIVIIITNPYAIMRLIQGYTYAFGTHARYKIIGNQALCSECTAGPFESNEINLSVLCAGTRYIAGWAEDEMALGIPFSKFPPMADGLWETVNIMETDKDKRRIRENLEVMAAEPGGLPDHLRLEIEMGKNYFTGEYLKQGRRRDGSPAGRNERKINGKE